MSGTGEDAHLEAQYEDRTAIEEDAALDEDYLYEDDPEEDL